MSTDIELTEEAVKYLDTLEPAERDNYYRMIEQRKNRPPTETLESLTGKLAELGKSMNPNHAERTKVAAEIDRRLALGAEHKLSLFISDELDKEVVNIRSIQMKAASLGLPNYDVMSYVKSVTDIRAMHKRIVDDRQQAESDAISKKKEKILGG